MKGQLLSAQWELSVDRALCIGSGLCAGTAPKHFRLGSDRRSQPLSFLVNPDDEVVDAAVSCPVEAIMITECGSERRLFPEDSLDNSLP